MRWLLAFDVGATFMKHIEGKAMQRGPADFVLAIGWRMLKLIPDTSLANICDGVTKGRHPRCNSNRCEQACFDKFAWMRADHLATPSNYY